MPRASIYVPLVAYLAAQDGDTVTLTFAEIEAIIGRPLAVTAQVSPAFWTSTHGLGFLRDLHALGWRASLRAKQHAVAFRRNDPVREG